MLKEGPELGNIYMCIDLNNAEKIVMPKKF